MSFNPLTKNHIRASRKRRLDNDANGINKLFAEPFEPPWMWKQNRERRELQEEELSARMAKEIEDRFEFSKQINEAYCERARQSRLKIANRVVGYVYT